MERWTRMDEKLEQKQEGAVVERDEPPVVARLVIEIRSDGTRTIARGAMEDGRTGEKAQIEAEGATPLLLIASLLKTLGQAPSLVREAATRFLAGKRKP
jgi:hypothetical protein